MSSDAPGVPKNVRVKKSDGDLAFADTVYDPAEGASIAAAAKAATEEGAPANRSNPPGEAVRPTLMEQLREGPASRSSRPGASGGRGGANGGGGDRRQRLLQAASDLFLGATSGIDENGEKRDFYVRQLRDGKGSVVIEALSPDDMKLYAKLCGRALAHAHARTASRVDIAEYLGAAKGFPEAIADFSVAYADLTGADHAAMLAAIDQGRLQVHELA